MGDSRQLLRMAAAIVSCAVSVSCLESVEPTPESTVLSIQPLTPYVRGVETAASSRFQMEFRIRNNGTRPVYLDLAYRRFEKLVDQRWELAAETTAAPFTAVRTIQPGVQISVVFSVVHTRGSSSFELIEHVRGLYRARLRLAYNPGGTDQMPVEDSYSLPFVVTE